MAGVDRRCQSVASPLDAGLRRGRGSFRGAPARGPFRYPALPAGSPQVTPPYLRVCPGYRRPARGVAPRTALCPWDRPWFPSHSHPSPAHPACGVAPGIPVLPTGSPRVPSLYLAGSPQVPLSCLRGRLRVLAPRRHRPRGHPGLFVSLPYPPACPRGRPGAPA